MTQANDSWKNYNELVDRFADAGGTSNPLAKPINRSMVEMRKRLEASKTLDN